MTNLRKLVIYWMFSMHKVKQSWHIWLDFLARFDRINIQITSYKYGKHKQDWHILFVYYIWIFVTNWVLAGIHIVCMPLTYVCTYVWQYSHMPWQVSSVTACHTALFVWAQSSPSIGIWQRMSTNHAQVGRLQGITLPFCGLAFAFSSYFSFLLSLLFI